MLYFLVQFILCGWHYLGPVCQGVEHTLFSCDVVAAVPVEILVCMGWFPVNWCAEGASCSMVTSVSRKGSEPCCVGSTVNWMLGSWLLMCLRRSWLCSAWLMTKVSSTNLSHTEGGGGGAKGFDFKLFHEDVGYEGADGGSHGCILDLFIILTLEEEVSVGEAELQQGSYLWDGHVSSLWESSVLLESLFNYL